MFALGPELVVGSASTRLMEVYPHPALMTFARADLRLLYKTSRSAKYWPNSTPAERRANLIVQWRRILSALKDEISEIHLEMPDATSTISTSRLKRYEDSLDALVCAWVGAKYLLGEAVAYGDGTADIWVP